MYTRRSTSKESDGKNCGSNVKTICPENVTFSTNASEYCYYFLLSSLGQSVSPFTLQFSCIIINL